MPPAKRARTRRKRARKKRASDGASPPEAAPLKPSGEKVPERPDNLRRRAEWFKRRTGVG